MSLIDPTFIEKHWRKIAVGVGLLVLIGLVLFGADKCSDYRFRSKQEKLKANVNTALANVAETQKVIANLKERQAVEVEAVNRATKEYLDAANVTDATKQDTNKALANMANAAKSNGNVTVKELEEKLRGL